MTTAAILDGRIWVFGGVGAGGWLNDVWSSSDGAHWVAQTLAAPWEPRDTEYSAEFQGALWIFGGKTEANDASPGYRADVWRMSRSATGTATRGRLHAEKR